MIWTRKKFFNEPLKILLITNALILLADAIIGGVIASNFGFTALFIVMAILSLTSAIYIFFLPRQVL